MNVRSALKDIFTYAVDAVNPYKSVRSYIEDRRKRWGKGVYIVGFGKAVSQMARACEDVLGESVVGGYLITKYGHFEKPGKLPVKEAAHPVPDENGHKYSRELVGLVKNLSVDDEVICLISGGGSALFCNPYKGISLSDKQKTTDNLLKAGADIFELNTVRKHLSEVKGGRFLRHFPGRRMTSLILSDVIGDRLDVIASGPTTFDESTFEDAVNVIHKYKLEKKLPGRVMSLLKNGANGKVPETIKKGDDVLDKVENVIIGGLSNAMTAAEKMAEDKGMEVMVSDGFVTGEAIDAGRNVGKGVKKIMERRHNRPFCIISGGETTVTVKGSGKGGRNMELALSFAKEIEGIDGVTMLSAGTDGGDGPTDAAGAIVDGGTISRAGDIGLNAQVYLSNNDTYNYFQKTGELFITGPTGTNVMDIQVVIIE